MRDIKDRMVGPKGNPAEPGTGPADAMIRFASVALTTWMFATIGLSCAGFAIGISISSYVLLPGAVLAMLAAVFASYTAQAGFVATLRSSTIRWGIVLTLACVAVALIISIAVPDLSYDGQNYHAHAIRRLALGWNPLHADSGDAQFGFVDSYAKGPWIIGTVLYLITGSLEVSKAVNWLLLFASFGALWTVLRTRGLSTRRTAVIAALTVGNPIVVLQLFNRYTDGVMVSCLLLAVCTAYLWNRAQTRQSASLFVMGLVLLASSKFIIGLLLAGIVGLVALLVPVVCIRPRRLRRVLPVAGAAIVCTVLCVFSPYVTNTLRYGNPMFPAYGRPHPPPDVPREGAQASFAGRSIAFYSNGDAVLDGYGWIPSMLEDIHPSFRDMGRLKALFTLLFSETGNVRLKDEDWRVERWDPPRLKWPFTVTQRERISMTGEARVGGFGPLFGGAVLCSLLLAIVAGVRRSLETRATMVCTAALLATLLIHPAVFWARMVPQAWWLAVIPLIFVKRAARGAERLLMVLCVLVLTAAILVSTTCQLEIQVATTQCRSQQLSDWASSSGILVMTPEWGQFDIHYLTFIEHGVIAQPVTSLTCASPTLFAGTPISVCMADTTSPKPLSPHCFGVY